MAEMARRLLEKGSCTVGDVSPSTVPVPKRPRVSGEGSSGEPRYRSKNPSYSVSFEDGGPSFEQIDEMDPFYQRALDEEESGPESDDDDSDE